MAAYLRITPACAGKRHFRAASLLILKDHPRVCGEKSAWVFTATSILGSPPRVRGKGTPADFVDSSVGITPACAGKSFILKQRPFEFKDHPRVCGEKRSAPERKAHDS